jgi:hypothetical protein
LITGAGLRRPAVRVVRDGEVLDPSTWTRRARTGAVRIDDLVDPARVLARFDEGATVVLQSLQRWWPPLTRFCRSLEAELGHAVQANAYLTPAGCAGLAPHHDTHDVFVLQVHGTKHWVLREPLVQDPLARQRSAHEAAAHQPVLEELDLEPGDCLYLPRGTIHSAAAQRGASLHLTVGVLATTVTDLARRILDHLEADPALRRALPVGYAQDARSARAAVGDVAATLIRALEALDVEAVAGELVASSARRRGPLLEGMLVDLVHLDGLDDSTWVRRRPDLRARPVPDGSVLRLDLADRVLELPLPLSTALERLLDGAAHQVGSLADLLDASSRAVLVRRLIREGVLRSVDVP